MRKIELRKLAILSFLVALTVALEQVMQFLPSVQLTTLLMVLIAIKFDLKSSILGTITYVLLDNMLGGFGVHTIPMFISWILFVVTIHAVKSKNEFTLAILALLFGLFYGIMLGIPSVVIYKVNPIAYIIADVPFTLVFMLVNFLTVLWLYKPLEKIYNLLQAEIEEL